MPLPSRRGTQGPLVYPKPMPPSAYVPAPRENPLKARLGKQPQSQLPFRSECGDSHTYDSTQLNEYSPRQALTLSHAPLMAQGIQLVPVNTLPQKYHSIFPYKIFNATQSKCFNTVFNTNDNLVLSSPTGSGKTVVMELAVCRLMETFEPGTFKIIYQAPTKALCAERKRDWEKKFTPLGLKCTELTGDTQFNQLAEVKSGDVIVTTPEKWDSVTRRWTDHQKLLGLVRLFLIDEVHILKEARGATLEAVISRMKSIGSRVRFVALSATVPNSGDIASWLGKDCENSKSPAHEERLGEEFRPVKLEKVVYGYPTNSNDFIFDKYLDQKLYEVIQKHSQRKPVMVFCATRNICVSTAKLLAEKWSGSNTRERPWPAPLTNFSLRDRDLQATGKSGVAFHHAGLDSTDRGLIEKLFLEGHISVICCTSTLAVGVNLPTHLVVIKNTVSWQSCQMREYLDLEVMQMIGRAGRPQFDKTGVAVIMTKKDKKERYEKMISGAEKLESCLHLNLVEHLNAEIGLGTIEDIESAKKWLRSTFLYIRMKSNPNFYKFKPGDIESELENIIEKDIEALRETGFVGYTQEKLKCFPPGDAMARYYIKFETMKTIVELKDRPKCSEILTCISEAEEFKEFRIRSGEKSVLKEINSSPSMKWPVKVDISLPSHKANILIQFEIGCMEYPATEGLQKHRATLMQDKAIIFQHLNRLIRCICDIKHAMGDAVGCRNSLELARCIEAKVWENTPSMLLQVDGLGPVGVRKLVNNNIKTLDQLAALETHKIEMILSRNPPFGAKIKQEVTGIPRFRLFAQVTKVQANRRDPVKVNFRVEVGLLNEQPIAKWHGKLLHLYFLAERSDGLLIDFRRMPILKLSSNRDVVLQAELANPGQKITCHVACEEIVNTCKSVELDIDIEDSQFPPVEKRPTSILRKQYPEIGSHAHTSFKPTVVQTSIENKPFKPPSRETSNVTRADSDEFGDSEFERDLRESGATGEELMLNQETKPAVVSPWTAINSPKPDNYEVGFSINHTTDEVLPDQDDEDEQEISLPKRRSDGKWDCNHRCADKSSCRHLCCREGLERPSKQKKKGLPKATTRSLESPQAIASSKHTDGRIKTDNGQKKLVKEFPQAKLAHTAPRKRVSDLVNAANISTIPVVDLSNDDTDHVPPFKGNGSSSVRKLNELHSKCQTNKSIKLPRLTKPIFSYETGEKPQVKKKAIDILDELDELFADDGDDDVALILGMTEEKNPGDHESKKGKLEDDYGLDDPLFDSLDVYAMDGYDGESMYETPISHTVEEIPQKLTGERKPNSTRAISVSNNAQERKAPEGVETNVKTPVAILGSSSSELKSEPLAGAGPPFKKVRFNSVTKDKSEASSRSNVEMDTTGTIGLNDAITPNTTLSSQNKPEQDKESIIQQELLDFLGDCVVFVD
ncbi:hypothetical protein ABW19_dt0205545 [Dactylella cylindrospora]|nr:hypothetical protein ABW19_dt0205545 [Dactylella cylindrospora]